MTPGNLDIRLPIGLLFTLCGLLVAYGLVSDAAVYRRSLDINVNLWWGLAMLVFGALMLLFGRKGTAAARPAETEPAGRRHRGAGARPGAGARLKHGNYNLAQSRRDAEGEPQLFSASPRLCVRCLWGDMGMRRTIGSAFAAVVVAARTARGRRRRSTAPARSR